MILRPLCDSVDLEEALGYARGLYSRLAQGSRPRTYTRPFRGATDLLLVRVVLTLDPNADQVYIIKALVPPLIAFVENDWDDAGTSGRPFTGTRKEGWTDPQIISTMEPGDTGVLVMIGYGAGAPFTLESSNTSVCTVADRGTTFADVEAVGVWASAPDNFVFADLTADTCTVSGFTITMTGYGSTIFTLSRPGVGGYKALEPLYGGTHIFSHFTPTIVDLHSTGGFRFGGAARIIMSGHEYFESKGGMVFGGQARALYEKTARSVGGFVLGGSSHVVMLRRPKAAQIGPFSLSLTLPNSYQFPLAGTNHDGTPATTFRIVSKGVGFTSLSNTGLGVLGSTGVTFFTYVAVEGSVESLPIMVVVGVALPLIPPSANSFVVTVPFETRNSLQITMQGTARRGGSLSYLAIGAYDHITLPDGGFGLNPWAVSFPDTWSGSTTFGYQAGETRDGTTLWSATAYVTVTVAHPLCPAANFTLSRVDEHVGTIWTLDSTTPAPADGGPLTYLWELTNSPHGATHLGVDDLVFFAPDLPGSYTIKLTVSDQWGQTSSKIVSVTATAVIVPPEIVNYTYSYNIFSTALPLDKIYTFRGVAKRGAVSLQYLATRVSPGVSLQSPALGVPTYNSAVHAVITAPGTYFIWYVATETVDGVPATSAEGWIKIVLQVQDAPLVVSGSTGRVSWTGGKPPFTLGVGGVFQNLPLLSPYYFSASPATIPLPAGFCTVSGVFTITDGSSPLKTGSVSMAQCGVPACGSGPPPGEPAWQKVWTSPARDIRTYPAFASFMVLQPVGGVCQYVNPSTQGRREFLSNDGRWKVVGDYWEAVSARWWQLESWGYGTAIENLDGAGFPVGYGDFANSFTTCGDQFWVRELWHYQ